MEIPQICEELKPGADLVKLLPISVLLSLQNDMTIMI